MMYYTPAEGLGPALEAVWRANATCGHWLKMGQKLNVFGETQPYNAGKKTSPLSEDKRDLESSITADMIINVLICEPSCIKHLIVGSVRY